MFDYTCRYCGKLFSSRRPPQDKRAPRYCSKKCADDVRRKHTPRLCIVCGEEFTPTRAEQKHCSKECSYVTHRARAIVSCAYCGNPFNRSHADRKFCSQHCYGSAMLGTQSRKGKEFSRAIRCAIRKRDNNCCIECGSTKQLEVDHIIPASLGGDNSLENGQLLCHNCHSAKSLRQRKQVIINSLARRGLNQR